MRLQIASVTENRGMSVRVDDSTLRGKLCAEIINGLNDEKDQIKNGIDVVIRGNSLLQLQDITKSVLGRIYLDASNSELGDTYTVLGSEVKLHRKGFEVDREIIFLNNLLMIIEHSLDEKIYIINRALYERSDGTSVIFPILRDLGALSVEALLTTVNENRARVNNGMLPINSGDFVESLDHFHHLNVISVDEKMVRLTEKGSALILR